MKIKSFMQACMAAVAACAVFSANADEWFVDLTRPDDAGPGTSEDTAFKTIKAAVAAASADDIITVLPGVYNDEWSVDGYGYTNRVYLSKKLHLRSRKGAKQTFIVGRHDPATDGNTQSLTAGLGTAAIRCVLAVGGSTIEGFTLADGGGHTSGDDYYHSWAGGAVSTSSSAHIYLVDCVVTNCVGYRGGAVRYCTAVRCLFTGNNGQMGNVARDIIAMNCLIIGNGHLDGSGSITDAGTANFYNCTLACNRSQYAHMNGKFFNCIEMPTQISGNGYLSSSSGSIVVTNSVLSYGTRNTSKLTTDEYSVINPPKPQFIASALDDWRIVKGADAEGLGDAALLANVTLPEGIDPYFDLAGRKMPKTGAIQAGCFQEVVEPAGGAVVFANPGTLNGVAIPYYWTCAHPMEYPAQWNYKAKMSTNQNVYAYIYNKSLKFPLMDDSLGFMPPSDVNAVATNESKVTSKIYYVSPKGNDDDNDGLSPDHPFKTLQKAVNTAPSSASTGYDSTMTVIIAAAGDYNEGGSLSAGVTNRVGITSNKRIRIKGAGRDSTTIFGRHDPASPAGDGRGTNAVRCVYSGSGLACAVQGFTLANGACFYKGDGTASTTDQYGGIVSGNASTTTFILDCTLTNGSAYRGAAASAATICRSRITGCNAGNGLTINTQMYGCLVYNNNGVIRNEDKVRQCTVYAADGARGAITSGTIATNCVVRDCKAVNLGTAAENCTGGNVLNNFNNIYGTYAAKSNSVNSPQFVDAADGDFRVKTTSPALTVGVYDANYWKYYTLDVDGRKILFFNGRPLAGGVQDVQQVIAAPTSAYCTFEPSAVQTVDRPGDSVTWTASDFTRPPVGFATNGVPVEGAAESFTYVWDGTPKAGSFEAATYLFDTNWYVNAETGLDSNTGFTAETPKKTLAAAMGVPLLAGDVVHLAEGVYSNGLMGTDTTLVSNRVVVTKAITLVGDGDRANTIVEGAPSPSPEYTSYGYALGPGAVRCGYFKDSGATVRNITFRNGSTYYLSSSSASPPCHGGGVSASSDVVFEDCAFVSNRACRAGGACGGTFRRCLFDGNWAQAKSAHVMSHSTYGTGANCYNCIFGKGHGSPTQDIGNMVGCFFDKFYAHDGSENNYGIIPSASRPFINNILLCGLYRPTSNFYPSNCVYVATANSGGASYFHPVNCIYTNTAAVNAELDSATRQIKSRTSWLVDAGATEYATRGGEKDFAGGQRVYNGAVDIGPHEYDWRARYSEDIDSRAKVTYASPEAVEQDGRVTLPDGAAIGVSVNGRSIKGVGVRVSGGELAATGGRKDETFTEDGTYRITTPADLEFSYSGEGLAVIDELVMKPGIMLMVW